MTPDKRIDFSALDPSQDRLRWQARIGQIVNTTMLRRRQREDFPAFLLRYARPALAIAAALALVSWIGARQSRANVGPSALETPSSTVLEWATNDQVPSTLDVFDSLGAP